MRGALIAYYSNMKIRVLEVLENCSDVCERARKSTTLRAANVAGTAFNCLA